MITKDPSKKTVYYLIEDGGNHDLFYDKSSRINGMGVPYFHVRAEIEKLGYNFVPTFDYSGLSSQTDVACIISNTLVNQQILQSISKHPKEKCFLFINEPYTTFGHLYNKELGAFFGKIFVMFEEMVDNQLYFKYLHSQGNEVFAESVPTYEEKKFCVMVQSNHYISHPKSTYEERRKAAHFFSKMGGFDLYGARWDGFSSWKGVLKENKLDVIKKYKFCVCYENISNQRGYITERIFDSFYSGCIPVYLGPEDIYNYIPRKCFINVKEFSSYEDLYVYMNSIDGKLYESYVSAARNFINSNEGSIFSSKQLSRTVIEHLQMLEKLNG